MRILADGLADLLRHGLNVFALVLGGEQDCEESHGHPVDKARRLGHHQDHAWHCLDSSAHLARHRFGGLQRGAFGQLDEQPEFTLVFLRHPVALDHVIQEVSGRKGEQANGHDDPAMIERPIEHPSVQALKPGIVCGMAGGGAGLAGLLALQQAGADGRRNREGHQHRNHDRDRHGPAELVEKLARIPGHERDGDEDDDQGKRGGDHGERDFLGGQNRRLFGRKVFFFEEAIDIFEHDDGVVDNDTHG